MIYIDIELIKQKLSEIDFKKLYEDLRISIDNFKNNVSNENELAMREAEKNYYVNTERFYGYQKLLKGQDASEHKREIDRLETEFNKIRGLKK